MIVCCREVAPVIEFTNLIEDSKERVENDPEAEDVGCGHDSYGEF